MPGTTATARSRHQRWAHSEQLPVRGRAASCGAVLIDICQSVQMLLRRSAVGAIAALGMLVPCAGLSAAAAPKGWPRLRAGEAYGIDVAAFQGHGAWPQVARAGISIAYVKATQGTSYLNPLFTADWQGARASGLEVGAYHFFSFCSPRRAEARSLPAAVPKDPSALPPAVDLELRGNCSTRPSASEVTTQPAAAVERSTGKTPLFYVGLDLAAHYKLAMLRMHSLWFRRTHRPSAASVAIWQPRALFQAKGIVGGVDLDIARLRTLRAS